MLMWLLLASAYIILFPLWQGRHSIARLVRFLLKKEELKPEMAATPDDSLSEDVGLVEETHLGKE